MTEYALTRSSADRRRYELAGFGTLRLGGWASRWATAQAGDRRWGFARRGIFRARIEATDPTGNVVGTFAGRSLKRGGTVVWDGREYVLTSDSAWRERYALLAGGDTRVALLEGKGWGKRPVRVDVDDSTIDAGLLLFAAFVVRALAEDAGSAAGGAAAGAGAVSA